MKRGRRRKFTSDEIAHMREMYNRKERPLSAQDVAIYFRCSASTVLRAVEGKLKPKDAE